MKNLAKYIAVASIVLGLTSCDDLFEPAIENIKDENNMANEPNYADAILGSAYILMPYPSTPENDVATDDAVSNDINNEWLIMAGGAWTSQTGLSVNNWRDRNASIQYCNIVLSRIDEITFAADEVINEMFRDRLRGEAYGLRALNLYYLLQNYGGKTADGTLMGVPIWLTPFSADSELNLPRNTFAECVKQIFDDLDAASALLPVDYKDVADNEVPAKYASKGVNAAVYNRVNGATTHLRFSGRIAEAIAAQTAILAASPAFSDQSGVSWEEAARRAGTVLNRVGGAAGLAKNGHLWYTGGEIGNSVTASVNHAEIIWRSGAEDNSTIEGDNFPPSIYGKGRVNPTQNLVDAFPMANGYPITDERSGYDPANPYAGRDPRLAAYVVTDGSKLGVNNSEISTGADSPNNDGINKEAGYSTRTGYYLHKLLRDDVNPNSTNEVKKPHYTARIRFTEIFLDYAEAANEAWGPMSGGQFAYSAYDVIKAIRQRAGLGVDGEDPYLDAAAASKDAMRELIRNERRLELCFENKRFWDLRRWKADLNQTAKGVSINGTSYNYLDVESRRYSDYMIYGPLPYNDVLKFSNLQQNAGW